MPRTVEVKVYQFEELSEEAQEKAHEDWLGSGFEYFWVDEAIKSLNKFEEIFPIKIGDYSVGAYNTDVRWRFTGDDALEELDGLRLAKYIWNNYKTDIFKPKFIGSMKTNELIKHKRIKSSEQYSNGNRSNHYYSGCQIDTSCVLTGVCFDQDILDPIYEFLKKPDGRNFPALVEDCIKEWEKSIQSDCQYQESLESFKETCEANEFEFTESGKRY
jgi:hypothetical protein